MMGISELYEKTASINQIDKAIYESEKEFLPILLLCKNHNCDTIKIGLVKRFIY